jgi:hypothetical protein
MTNRKILLNNLIDIGGVATINNFYSLKAKSYAGSLLQARRFFKFFVAKGLVKKLDPITNPRNPSQEVFYAITKRGSNYAGRDDYKYRGMPKSPFNAFHESMKFDFALAWINLYGIRETEIRYNQKFGSLMPDITITVHGKETHKYLVELERKKTIDRTERDKFKKYDEMFSGMRSKKYDNPKNFTVLFVYTNTWYNVFARPHQYWYYANEIAILHNKTKELSKLAKHLTDNYLFMPFPDFYCLNDKIWFTPDGNKTNLVI